MANKKSPFTGRHSVLAVLAVACVATSFTLGMKSAGDVQPFTLIEAGSDKLPGDVNDDGIVTLEDAVTVLEMSQGYIPVTPEAFKADPNEDGRITVDDAITILRQLVQ